MQLTPLQLQIQERSDKTLSFWCLLDIKTLWDYDVSDVPYWVLRAISDCDFIYWNEVFDFLDNTSFKYTIIWHPMNRWRLCYLYKDIKWYNEPWRYMFHYFKQVDNNCCQQTVLERPVELQELVLNFLLTLPKCN